AVRDRRDDRYGGLLRIDGAAADRLLVSGVRGAAVCDRADDGVVRLPQPSCGDEQPSGASPGRWLRDEHDVPELRSGALDRSVVHVVDRWALEQLAGEREPRPDGTRRAGGDSRPGVASAAGRDAVRGVPRLQPGTASARPARARACHHGAAGRADQPDVLPGLDQRALPYRSADRDGLCDRDEPARRRVLVGAWWQVPLQRARDRARGRTCGRLMGGRRTTREGRPVELRIGEVAKLTGLTARTLRYWEELDLLA